MFRLRKALYLLSCGLLFALVLNACADATASNSTSSRSSSSSVLNVVAGENFWGSIATQLGGTHVSVTSIVNDPNADPHQYEGSTQDARAFAQANYIILNGAGYDSWGQKLLDANPVSGRKVFTVADLLGKHEGDNPHFWYNPSYVEQVSNQITRDYSALDPADSAYFTRQRAAFETALSAYHQRIAEIQEQVRRAESWCNGEHLCLPGECAGAGPDLAAGVHAGRIGGQRSACQQRGGVRAAGATEADYSAGL